jgi:hypothetical protein
VAADATRAAFDNATAIRLVPDSAVLSAGRREPPAFPAGVLPDSVWALALDLADGAAAPVDYVACAMLVTAATVIGGSRRVQAYQGHKWTEPSILWIGAVGDPSSGKSPAIEVVIEPLRDIEREMASDFNLTLRQWETDDLSAKLDRDTWGATVKDANKQGLAAPTMPLGAVAPMKPARPRLIVQDATPEGMAAVLVTNQRLLSYRDELAGWFQGFDRYAPGGRTQWLEAFGGRPFTIDRKGADGPVTILFNGVSVLGGIQPDKLASIVLAGDDDGLAARFMWTWPRTVPYKRPHRLSDTILWPSILRRLVSLPFTKDINGEDCAVTIPLDDEAADIFEAWRKINGTSAHDGGPLFKSFLGKLPGMVLRLALVLELMEWAERGGAEPDTICSVVLMRARDFVEGYLKPMAMRVFGDAALPVVERNAATLARYIIRTKARMINLRTVQRARLPGLTTAELVNDAAEVLTDALWLFPAGTRAGDTPGRKSRDFTINPLVHTVDHGVSE